MDLHLSVKPNSRENKILFGNGAIVVRLKAAPVEGKANRELLAYLSEVLGVPKSRLGIASGLGSKFKKIHIPEEYQKHVEQTISRLMDDKVK